MKYKFYKEDIINIDDFISEMVELLNKIKMEKYDICRFVKHMRHHLMLKGFIAILLFFCC